MPPSGFQKFPVHNIKEIEVLLMCDKSYCAEVAHNNSSKNCKAIVERKARLAIRFTNSNATLHSEENEYIACMHIVFVLRNIKFCQKCILYFSCMH